MQLNPLLKLGRNTRPRGRLRGRRVADRFHDLQVDERLRRRQRARDGYAVAFYEDPAATLDDLREAVTTLEDAKRIARRVLGGAHPITESVEVELRKAQAALRAREAPPSSA